MGDATRVVLYGLLSCGVVVGSVALANVSVVLVVVALVTAVVAPAVYVARRETALAAEVDASGAWTHAGTPLGRIEGLLQQHPDDLRRRIAAIRCYASPEYRGSVRGGMMVGVYYTVAIDHDGGVHPIDTADRFGELESRAAALATRLGVPHQSLI